MTGQIDRAADEPCLGETETPARAAAAARVPDYPEGDPRREYPFGPECVVAWVADTGDHLDCQTADSAPQTCAKFEVRVKRGRSYRWEPMPPLENADGVGLTRPVVAVGADRLPVVAWSFLEQSSYRVRVARWDGSGWRYDDFGSAHRSVSNPRFFLRDDGTVELAVDEDEFGRRFHLEEDSWVPLAPTEPPAERSGTSGILDWVSHSEVTGDSFCTDESGGRQFSSRVVSAARSPSDPNTCLVAWLEDSASNVFYNASFWETTVHLRAKIGRQDLWIPLGGPIESAVRVKGLSTLIGTDGRPVIAYSALGRYAPYVKVGVWDGEAWRVWAPAQRNWSDNLEDPRLSANAQGGIEFEMTRGGVKERYLLVGNEWVHQP